MNSFRMRAAVAALAALCQIQIAGAAQGPTEDQWRQARTAAADIAQRLAQLCPVAPPDSQPAVESCRHGLYHDASLQEKLTKIVLWGRQKDPSIALKDASLTQFATDALTGMYLPLFMFNGEHRVIYDEREGLFQLRVRTAFRNRLQPGQFPYPFWHENEKWSMYQNAREVIFWWDPKISRVKVAQFTVHSTVEPLLAVAPVPAPVSFQGQWMWTDDKGQTQPAVTVFDGIFRRDNPYLAQLDASYKQLALRLREGQCDHCHVPNNPDKMKRLVLLQTPAHAAAEIQRVLKSVREDRMPRDETGIEQPLDPHTKEALLQDGEAFAKLVEAAKRWEAGAANQQAGTGTRQTSQPVTSGDGKTRNPA
jgi:hypothetical protein